MSSCVVGALRRPLLRSRRPLCSLSSPTLSPAYTTRHSSALVGGQKSALLLRTYGRYYGGVREGRAGAAWGLVRGLATSSKDEKEEKVETPPK